MFLAVLPPSLLTSLSIRRHRCKVALSEWNAEVRCPIGNAEPGRVRSSKASSKLPSRRVRFLTARESREVDVFRFEVIPADATIIGPAIVESSFTSIVIDPGATAVRDDLGTLVIEV
jgi:N-methylhydantoinase A